MVVFPPQHGKSSLASHYFPAWYLGHNPDNRVILGSYESNFAASWGRKARDTLEAWGPSLFSVSVDQRSGAADDWNLKDRAGGMITAGRGHGITGRPAHLIVIDDPFKDHSEANSATIREQAWDWYRTSVYPRLATGGAIIWIQTRWHEDDAQGRLLRQMQEGGEQWEVLHFEALTDGGQPLCPELHSMDELLKIRDLLGGPSGYYWQALYQGRPQPATGDIFKRDWFRYFAAETGHYVLFGPEGAEVGRWPIAGCWKFQTCDPAATEKDQNDWFVNSTWAVTPESDLLLIDVYRDHAATTRHEAILKQEYQKYRPQAQGVENKTFGLNIIQSLSGLLPIVPLEASGDKVARARGMAARYQTGKVYHLREAPWLGAWESELVDFPRGRWDDQVDTASYAAILLTNYSLAQPVRLVYDQHVEISRY